MCLAESSKYAKPDFHPIFFPTGKLDLFCLRDDEISSP